MHEIILFLASDPIIRKAISNALESKGYCVLTASNMSSALEYLKECTPDLLLVRHYTEGLPGHEAATHMRKVCPGIPVLLVGGILDDEELEDRATLRGFEIFPRPFTAAELLDKVKEVLNKHSLRGKTAAKPEQQ
jgi:two-component system cell cycle sensor histidine kinase/response regulator CckA